MLQKQRCRQLNYPPRSLLTSRNQVAYERQGKCLFIANEGEYLAKLLRTAYNKAPKPKSLKLIAGNAYVLSAVCARCDQLIFLALSKAYIRNQ